MQFNCEDKNYLGEVLDRTQEVSYKNRIAKHNIQCGVKDHPVAIINACMMMRDTPPRTNFVVRGV